MQLELQHASRVPLLRTPPEGFCSSSYKHATPAGVKTVNAFFHGFGRDSLMKSRSREEGHQHDRNSIQYRERSDRMPALNQRFKSS